MNTSDTVRQPIRSAIPAHLDRLHWSPFHTRMVIGLGVAWILDARGLRNEMYSTVDWL